MSIYMYQQFDTTIQQCYLLLHGTACYIHQVHLRVRLRSVERALRLYSGRKRELLLEQPRAVPCRSGNGNNGNGIGGRVLSMAEDNSKDAFFLTTAGVFRVVPSGSCGARPPPPPQLPAATGWQLAGLATALALAFFVCWTMLGGGGLEIHVEGCCNNHSILCCLGHYWAPKSGARTDYCLARCQEAAT